MGEGVGWEQELYVTLHSHQEIFVCLFVFCFLLLLRPFLSHFKASDESHFNVLLIARSEVAIKTVYKNKTSVTGMYCQRSKTRSKHIKFK